MNAPKPRNINSRLKSIRFALMGMRRLARQEPNMRLHIIAAIGVIIAGCFKGLSRIEWVAITIAIGIVFIAEAFNTCIELLCDLYSKDYNKSIETIKDISAAAVLIAAFISAVMGLIVFFF